jgi:hypothetical protein
MTRYVVNEDGVRNAERLIRAGDVDSSTDWSDGQPSTDEENAFIDANGYEAFGAWHLAIDPDAGEGTKARYAFPFGDYEKLHRDGLTSAKQRAAQYEHQEIARAADRLLEQVAEG